MFVRLLLLLVTAAAEVVPLAQIAGLIDIWNLPNRPSRLATLSLLAAVLLGFAVMALLSRRGVSERQGRIVLTLAAFAAAAPLYLGGRLLDGTPGVLTPRALAVTQAPQLALLLYAWARGAMLARENMTFDAIYATFRRGLIVLSCTLVLTAFSAGDPLQAPAARQQIGDGWGRVIVFFVAALCALSLARVEEERRRGAGVEGPPPVRGEWLMTLLAAIGGVSIAGIALATVVSPAGLDLALAPLGRLYDLLVWLLTPLLWALSMALDPLVRFLRSLQHHKPPVPPPPRGKPPKPPHLVTHAPQPNTAVIAHDLLLLAGIVAALVALWYAFFYRQQRALERNGEEERESLWSWSLLAAALRALLRRLRARVFGAGSGAAAPTATHPDEIGGAMDVRAIYRRLLARAAALGVARRRDETPHEFLTRLRGAAPAGERDAALLTGVYTRVRYGPAPPNRGDAAAAREAWARLEPALARDPAGSDTRERPANR